MPTGVLKELNKPPTLMQKILGGLVAGFLTRNEPPPLTPEKVIYYYAALVGHAPDRSRVRIARALLVADLKQRCYRLSCLDWYVLVAECYPDDERCAFYVGGLCYQRLLLVEPQQLDTIYGRLMRPEWRESSLWDKLALSRSELLQQLVAIYMEVGDVRITSERLLILEAAFDSGVLTEAQLKAVATWLSVAYRASGRSDDRAEVVYRYLFLHTPNDKENNRYLAKLFAGRRLANANACAVYARMVEQAEQTGESNEKARWSFLLAHAYIAQGILGEETIPIFREALAGEGDNRLLEAAFAYVLGRADFQLLDAGLLKHLEKALAFEAELVPFFSERQWQWSVVPRALALAWGSAGRRDSLACFVYARAVDMCPEEKALWGYYAAALADTGDRSVRAIAAFEKAQRYELGSPEISAALADAYLANGVPAGSEVTKALSVWEGLYHSGKATPDVEQALIAAYLKQERLNDTGLEALQKLYQKTPDRGDLALRIAQELKAREELDAALAWYKEAERRLPQHFTTLFELGVLTKSHAADYRTAATYLSRAAFLPAGVNHLDVHLALAECLIALERRDDAKRVYQIIIDRIDPKHTPTLLQLARLNLKFEAQGAMEAQALYERALDAEPDNPETYRRLAEMYHSQGNTVLEEWALEQYLKVGPPDAERCYELALLYLRRGDFPGAEGALRQIIALGKADKQIYTMLGDVIQKGDRSVA